MFMTACEAPFEPASDIDIRSAGVAGLQATATARKFGARNSRRIAKARALPLLKQKVR